MSPPLYHVPQTGDVAVSPTHRQEGYYYGEPLKRFVHACLNARLPWGPSSQLSLPAEITFFIAGEQIAIDDFARLNVKPIVSQEQEEGAYQTKKQATKTLKNAKKMNSFEITFEDSHLETIRSSAHHGQSISLKWVRSNYKNICDVAENILIEKGWASATDEYQHISVISPKGSELYEEYKPGAKKGPIYLKINFKHWHCLWENQKDLFINQLGKVIAFFITGHNLVTASMQDPSQLERVLADTDLNPQLTASLFSYFGTPNSPNVSGNEIEYLSNLFGLDTHELTHNIQNYQQSSVEDKKAAVYVYSEIFLASWVFFKSNTLPYIEMSKSQHISGAQIAKVHLANILFSLVETASFLMFPGNILYARPEAMDDIQKHLSNVSGKLFNKRLSFPVTTSEETNLEMIMRLIQKLNPTEKAALTNKLGQFTGSGFSEPFNNVGNSVNNGTAAKFTLSYTHERKDSDSSNSSSESVNHSKSTDSSVAALEGALSGTSLSIQSLGNT